MATHAFYIRATPTTDSGNHRVGAIAYKVRKDGKLIVAGSLVHPSDRKTTPAIPAVPARRGKKAQARVDAVSFNPKSCLLRASERLKVAAKRKILDIKDVTTILEVYDALGLPVTKHYLLDGAVAERKLAEMKDKAKTVSKLLNKAPKQKTAKAAKTSKPTTKSKAK